jgi:alcohol dehydrogenase/L-iditol 2-dehydrogenase
MIGLVNYAKDPHSVELRELPIPEIGEEDVLLSVQAAGICGSVWPDSSKRWPMPA